MNRFHVRFVRVGVLSLGLATVAWLPAVGQQAAQQNVGGPSAAAPPSTGLQAAAALEDVLVKAIAASERSVVAIARVTRADDDRLDSTIDLFGRARISPSEPEFIPNEYATGVIVDADGLILTAHHVLRDNSTYWVTTVDRKTYQAKILAADPRSDLAVLKIGASGLAPIRFGDATKLKKGQIVVALGNPYAIARDGQASASWGIVSNLGRKDGPTIPRAADGDMSNKPALHQYGSLIQTDAKLNLGTSGGALVNLKGEMVGLTLSLAAAIGYEQSAGFALPVDEAFRRAVDRLKQGREVESAFLGIKPANLTPSDRDRGKQGVVVMEIVPGTPAMRSELRPQDLITRINGEEIHGVDDLMLDIGKLAPDASAELIVEREGKTISIAIGELSKIGVSGRKIVTNPPPAWRGIRVDYVTASRNFQSWAQQRRLDPQGSVVITEVEQDSPAWNEGLRPEMMISHVGGKRVATPKDFLEAVTGQEGPIQVRLTMPASDRPVRVIPPVAG